MVPTPPHLVGSTGLHQQYPPKMAPVLGGSSPHITVLTTAIAGHHSQSCWGQVLHISVPIIVIARPLSQPTRGQTHPPAIPQQSQPKHNREIHAAHTGDTPRAPSYGDGGLGIVPLAPLNTSYIRPLFQDQEIVGNIPNTQKHRELGKVRRQRKTLQMKG